MKIQVEKIKNLLIEGNLEEALRLLNEGSEYTAFENESTLLFSRFNKIQKEKISGIIDEEVEQREYNKIVISSLELLSRAVNSFFHEEVLYDTLLFYETPQENFLPKENREYATEFESEKVRHIGWELPMRYPRVGNTFNFSIKWQLTRPNNNVMPVVTNEFVFQEGWSNSWVTNSWGTEKSGTWPKGKSRIKLYIGDKLISEGEFVIK